MCRMTFHWLCFNLLFAGWCSDQICSECCISIICESCSSIMWFCFYGFNFWISYIPHCSNRALVKIGLNFLEKTFYIFLYVSPITVHFRGDSLEILLLTHGVLGTWKLLFNLLVLYCFWGLVDFYLLQLWIIR